MPNENHQRDALTEIDPDELDPDATVPAPDDLLSTLADPMRRRLVWYLVDREESTTTVEEVTDVLLGWGTSEFDVVGPDERERVTLALRHVHLPKLADCDLIDYDLDEGTIQLQSLATPAVDLVRQSYRYDRTVAAIGR